MLKKLGEELLSSRIPKDTNTKNYSLTVFQKLPDNS